MTIDQAKEIINKASADIKSVPASEVIKAIKLLSSLKPTGQ